MNALVIYGTRGGATKQIAEEIGKVLSEQGYATTVEDARRSGSIDVSAYDLIIVGSSVWATMWKWQASRFLKRNAKILSGKKVALFSSGLAGNDPAQAEYARTSIEKTAAKYSTIKPLALAYFGGYIELEHPSFFTSFIAKAMKEDLKKKGVAPGKCYDTRDFAAIRKWAEGLAAKAKA